MKRLIYALLASCMYASAAHAVALPITGQATNWLTENQSATITTGNTFQSILSVLASGARRQSLTIQNNNINGDNCWVFVGGGSATKGTSMLLAPGGSYQRYFPYVPSDAIQATCAGTNDTLYVDTQ